MKIAESRSKWNLPGTGAVGGREMSRGRSFNWHHAGGHRCGRSSSMKGGGGKELSRWCELVESWLWWQLPLQGVGASSSWTFKSSLFFQIIDFHFRYFRLMIPFLNIVQRIWHLQRYLSQVRLRRRLGRWLRLDATSNKAGNSTRQSSGHQHLEHLGSCGADGWGERALARWDLVYIYIFIYLRGSSMTGSVCSFQAENCGGRWQWWCRPWRRWWRVEKEAWQWNFCRSICTAAVVSPQTLPTW